MDSLSTIPYVLKNVLSEQARTTSKYNMSWFYWYRKQKQRIEKLADSRHVIFAHQFNMMCANFANCTGKLCIDGEQFLLVAL